MTPGPGTSGHAGSGHLVAALTSVVTAWAVIVLTPPSAAGAPPGTPSRPVAVASSHVVRLGWMDSVEDGGAEVTRYRVTSSTGATWTVRDVPATLTGLRNGVAVSFRVSAVNRDGAGPASPPSNRVTPRAPTSSNVWTATGSMRRERSGALAVLLRTGARFGPRSGRVLVMGGEPGDFEPFRRRSAELYDPGRRTWSAAASMDLQRADFTATLLLDGRVLVAGGFTPAGTVRRSTRLYDPERDRWSAGPRLRQGRAAHTATVLRDGRVLVAGGTTRRATETTDWAPTATSELYDPRTNRWSSTAPLPGARFLHSATRLRDGTVLVAGGTAGHGGLRTAAVYSPATGRWTPTGTMLHGREVAGLCCKGVALLRSGKVLVAGGYNPRGLNDGDVRRSAEVFDPATRSWAATGSMKVGRKYGFSLVRLRSGRVLVAGGGDNYGALKYAELYDETTGRWTRVNDLKLDRYDHALVLLRNGKVLAAGGIGTNQRRSAELFTPS